MSADVVAAKPAMKRPGGAAGPTLRASVSLVAALVGGTAFAQQPFPTHPIRFVVPYLAGGTTDLVARVVGERMTQTLGQPVVIENRGGAGGNIGMNVVAHAAPDGYTIGFGAISTNALNPHIYKDVGFDPRKDFTAIGMLGYSTIVMEVGAQQPIKDVRELIVYAKAHPGLGYGTAGVGTSMNLAGVLFSQATDTKLQHVPYRGSAPGINDMMGGTLPMMFDNLPASLSLIQSGKLRALAVTGSQRNPSLPDVPTLAEAGYPQTTVEPWFGVYAPAGVPAAIVQKLNAALVDALSRPDVKDKLTAAGFTPKGSTPDALETLTQAEYVRLGKIARDAHMTVE
jgi:tripartite-type tricarboxylate transporter receptor subunit TctC